MVTQSAADTFTQVAIDTNLAIDSKIGWTIEAVEAFWVDGLTVAAADFRIDAVVSTVAASTNFQDDTEIARLSWGLQNTGGVAVAVPYEPLKSTGLIIPRLTVTPFLYLGVASTGTAIANDVVFKVYYSLTKVSENEYFRLRAVGA